MTDDKQTYSRKWLWFFGGFLGFNLVAVIYFAYNPPVTGSLLSKFTDGINGNLLSGLLGGFLFLFLTLHLSAGTEKNISLSAEILSEEKRRKDIQRKIERFDRFMLNEGYHNFSFPDLKEEKDSLGLVYTIEPVKDENRNPIKRVTEMEVLYVVKVREPANQMVFDQDEHRKYFSSKIKENEYYFCKFFGSDWYLSEDSMYSQYHRIQFHSKMGQVESGQTAYDFLKKPGYQNFQEIATVELNTSGNVRDGSEPYRTYSLEQNSAGDVFLRGYESPPKKMYFLNEGPNGNRSILIIEDIRGYGNEAYLKNLHRVVKAKLLSMGISLPMRTQHQMPEGQFAYSKMLNE